MVCVSDSESANTVPSEEIKLTRTPFAAAFFA